MVIDGHFHTENKQISDSSSQEPGGVPLAAVTHAVRPSIDTTEWSLRAARCATLYYPPFHYRYLKTVRGHLQLSIAERY